MDERNRIRGDIHNDPKQLLKALLYLINKSSTAIYKTKLNKLLFYTQFLYYKKYRKPFFDEDFLCDYYGPVLKDLDKYLVNYENREFIKIEDTNFGNIIKPTKRISDSSYSEEEQEILNIVLEKFKSWTSREISEYSHKEKAWIDTPYKQIIDIEGANYLNEL